MAQNAAKTQSLGWAEYDQYSKWPGWDKYEKAAGQMTAAIAAATDAKGPIKDHIRRELVKKGKVASEDQIDFQIVGSGGRLKINKLLTAKKTRVKGENLF